MEQYWVGTAIETCDVCRKTIKTNFIDGRTSIGSWANMCPACHKVLGFGLGTGRGQKYEKQKDGRWLKVAGAILLAFGVSVAHAETGRITKDSMGYTHYYNSDGSGISHTDTMGYTHYQFQHRDGSKTTCVSSRNVNGVSYHCD